MEALGRTDNGVAAERFMVDGDDLLDFSLDGEEDEDEDKRSSSILKGSSPYSSSNPLISSNHHGHDDLSGSSSFPVSLIILFYCLLRVFVLHFGLRGARKKF